MQHIVHRDMGLVFICFALGGALALSPFSWLWGWQHWFLALLACFLLWVGLWSLQQLGFGFLHYV
jgi:hypothetical protein